MYCQQSIKNDQLYSSSIKNFKIKGNGEFICSSSSKKEDGAGGNLNVSYNKSSLGGGTLNETNTSKYNVTSQKKMNSLMMK